MSQEPGDWLRRSVSQEDQRHMSIQCCLGELPPAVAAPASTKWCPSVPPRHFSRPKDRTSPRQQVTNAHGALLNRNLLHNSLIRPGRESAFYTKKPTHYFRFTPKPDSKPVQDFKSAFAAGIEGRKPRHLPPLRRMLGRLPS